MVKTLSSCESHPEYSDVYNIEIGLAKLLDVSSYMRHPEGLISIPCWKRMPEAHTPWHSLHSGGERAAPSLAMDVTGDLCLPFMSHGAARSRHYLPLLQMLGT